MSAIQNAIEEESGVVNLKDAKIVVNFMFVVHNILQIKNKEERNRINYTKYLNWMIKKSNISDDQIHKLMGTFNLVMKEYKLKEQFEKVFNEIKFAKKMIKIFRVQYGYMVLNYSNLFYSFADYEYYEKF